MYSIKKYVVKGKNKNVCPKKVFLKIQPIREKGRDHNMSEMRVLFINDVRTQRKRLKLLDDNALYMLGTNSLLRT